MSVDGAPRADFIPGCAVPLGGGVQRLVAPNAGLMTGPGTNTYILGTAGVAVIDPGPDDERHLEAIIAAAPGPILWILVTHTHRDHSPLTAALKRRTGARTIGLSPPGDGRQDESFVPDHSPADGERLTLGDIELTAIHTPGHASNCVCYLLAQARLVFTGDHVLEGVSPVILPPDGDMTAYLRSLSRLEGYAFEWIAPGHGAVMTQGKAVIAALRAHRLKREAKVLAALTELKAAALDALTPKVYDDVPPERHAWARLTLEAHLIKLARDGRALVDDGVWRARLP